MIDMKFYTKLEMFLVYIKVLKFEIRKIIILQIKIK